MGKFRSNCLTLKLSASRLSIDHFSAGIEDITKLETTRALISIKSRLGLVSIIM